MNIKTRQVEGVCLMEISGPMLYREGDVQFIDAIKSLLGSGQKRFLLNLSECDYIDSSGLGALAAAYIAVRKQAGDLQLLNVNLRIRYLLDVTKLSTVFRVNDCEADGIHSLEVFALGQCPPQTRLQFQ